MDHLSPEDRLPRRGPIIAGPVGPVLYTNPLASAADLADWRLEGQATLTWPQQRLRLEAVLPASAGQKANHVLWCPQIFPDGVAISFDFHPLSEHGLAMLWFAATARGGGDLFDPGLPTRSGEYDQYRFGAIDAYHAAYYRRGRPGAFQICNLRKSHGFHLVAQGGDPIPARAWQPPYRIRMLIRRGHLQFEIDELVVYAWHDDGTIGGLPLGPGRIGFRQMAPLVAEYANLEIRALDPE